MIGVVLAGGASRRFGGQPKGLLQFGGEPLAVRVATMLSGFCAQVVIEAQPGAGYEALSYQLIHAEAGHAGKGPLAGIVAGLAFADRNTSDARVAFAPCDMPNLRQDIYEQLIRAGGTGAYACTSVGAEPLVAVLSREMCPVLLDALTRTDIPRTHAALDEGGAKPVLFADLPAFANVNTPDDLVRLEALLR